MNGDAWRKQAGTTMSPCTPDANPNFDMQNLNKRFVGLNMRTPEGHEAMMKLLEGADILVTNYRVQALEGMGLAYEQLKDRFPRLIHASVLGYGDKGPDKDRPGYDYTAFFSRSGLMADLPPPAPVPWCLSAAWATTAWRWLWPAASPPPCSAGSAPARGTRWTSPCFRSAPLSAPPAF